MRGRPATILVYTPTGFHSARLLIPLVLSSRAINSLGSGCEAIFAALRERSGLRSNDFEPPTLETWIGRVDNLEHEPVTGRLAEFDCRNNRLAQRGLRQDGFEGAVAQRRERYGAHRIAVLIGTSTSGVHETELAYRRRDRLTGALPPDFRYRCSQNVYSVADFVRRYLDLRGPAAAISTACSSSAKVFASAHRLIEAEFADAAVVGGVDSLCLTTLYGFESLELLSEHPVGRVMRRATGSRSARLRVSSCSNERTAMPGRSCSSVMGRAPTGITCLRRIPRGRACTWR
jgi:3-oxoacyl-[acyl-carrier-protein] synthase-1